MNPKRPATEPERYWNRAGEVSYAEAMYSSQDLERHIRGRLWQVAIEIADGMGVPRGGRVLDLGCGDGAFVHEALAPVYGAIDGYDLAPAAIDRANAVAHRDNIRFEAADLIAFDYSRMPRYDAVFMIGILHHVKQATPDIVRKIAGVTDRVIVLEPNGNNLMRKALEFTPSYRRAGEDSFGTRELEAIFRDAGFETARWRRMNLFPNFTPGFVYRLAAPLESKIESSRLLRALCTVNMFGFSKQPGANG